MDVVQMIELNRIGTIAWFINGKLMRRRGFDLLQIWALNWLTPLFRMIDSYVPLPALSLIAVMERGASQQTKAESEKPVQSANLAAFRRHAG